MTITDTRHATTATAAALVVAVADRDHVQIGHLLADLTLPQVRDLAVHLAGYVNVDKPLAMPPLSQERTVQACVERAAKEFGVTPAAIRSTSRRREHIDARHVAAYAARLCGLSYPTIGVAIDKDHTTVMNACGRVGELPRLRATAYRIAETIGRAPAVDDDVTAVA